MTFYIKPSVSDFFLLCNTCELERQLRSPNTELDKCDMHTW